MKRARNSNIEYFNAVFQDEKDSFNRVVCYSPEKRKKLEQLSTAKSPVKLVSIKKYPSKLKLFKNEISINAKTVVTEGAVTFDYEDFEAVKDDAPFTKLVDLPSTKNLPNMPSSSKEERNFVSVKVFVKVSDFPKVMVILPYLAEPIEKIEVCANDETGVIPLTLWGESVNKLCEDGTYSIINAVSKKQRNGQLYISTNTSTRIERLDEMIEPTQNIPVQLRFNTVPLPAENVEVSTPTYYCKCCKK